ncbi:MAG: tRNA (N(6)-L-threonylcarbamoyladenosine(37)-C(2))-methylthiotransferase MtaB [Planctomycetes bacterium]|nr:tRNA (N(6)-L-threonylcarbamoyladenosine(37)-C(2))-methylthiotransferase MtaB [Planctomycetota bacterium]
MEQPKTFAVETLGCKANQYDSHAIRTDLLARGLVEVPFGPGADAYVVNTCSVTSVAGRKSRQVVAQVARENPRALVVATGCYADTDREALLRMKGVDRVFRNAEKGFAGRYVAEALHRGPELARLDLLAHESCREPALPARVVDFGDQTRPFVKIQDGCDLLCTYCIIPKTRGGLASRAPGDVIEECRALCETGKKEIVLTGIHLGGYGHDLARPELLVELLEKLLELPGLERLRLSSIEVQEVRDDLIALAASHPRFCPHFHIPLQSGSDRVLRRMGRRYARADYLGTIERIRERVPRVALNTDVIVGFPGETEEDFEETLSALRVVGFSRLHVFPYSDRRGTPATRLPGKIDPRTVAARKARIARLARELSLEFHRGFVGREARVLVERRRDPRTGLLTGYTDHYVKALLEGADEWMEELVPVRVEEAYPDRVTARRVRSPAPTAARCPRRPG